jgi:hyperosmotically inducible protein
MRKKVIVWGLTATMLVPAAFANKTTTSTDPAAERVRHQLAMLPYYNVFDDLSFRINDGVVTLYGEVTNPVLKDDAGRAVKHIEGVQRVDNQIEVLPLSPFDNGIRRAMFRAIYGYAPLQRYGWGPVPAIHIIVKDGHVTLEGVVSSEQDKQLAYLRANGVPSVFSVRNNLRVQS